MPEQNGLFWSAYATGQFLELKLSEQENINACVEMIGQFPLIGVRMLLPAALEHRGRFICGGFRIIYCLEVSQMSRREHGDADCEYIITIKRFKPA